jgi:hypothetical protein
MRGHSNKQWSRIVLVVAGAVLPVAAKAQVSFDTTRVTCADYLAMSPTDSRLFSAFLNGWFNQKNGRVTVDLNEYERTLTKLQTWCRSSPKEIVFGGMQRATSASGQ